MSARDEPSSEKRPDDHSKTSHDQHDRPILHADLGERHVEAADQECGHPGRHRIEGDRLQRDAAIKCAVEGRSDEHTSELQPLMRISYAVFCLNKQKPIPSTSHLTLHLLNSIRYSHTTSVYS